jgi:hypothetical protein
MLPARTLFVGKFCPENESPTAGWLQKPEFPVFLLQIFYTFALALVLL